MPNELVNLATDSIANTALTAFLILLFFSLLFLVFLNNGLGLLGMFGEIHIGELFLQFYSNFYDLYFRQKSTWLMLMYSHTLWRWFKM